MLAQQSAEPQKLFHTLTNLIYRPPQHAVRLDTLCALQVPRDSNIDVVRLIQVVQSKNVRAGLSL